MWENVNTEYMFPWNEKSSLCGKDLRTKMAQWTAK